MLKHYLLIAIRLLKKYPTASLINILSLSLGLVCSLSLFFWIHHAYQMDRFHHKADRLYQVIQNNPRPNGISTFPYTPGPLAQTLATEFPEVEHAVSVIPTDWFEGEKMILSNGGENICLSQHQFASQDYLEVFSLELISGQKETALNDPKAVLISTNLAKQLFQTTEVTGKTIEWIHDQFGGLYRISGVFSPPPIHSSIQFDAIFHMDVFLTVFDDLHEWNNSDPFTFVTLKEDTDIRLFNHKIKELIQQKDDRIHATLYAQLFSDRYLYGTYENGLPAGGRISYVHLFSLIGLFILIMACVNFVNMSTAKGMARLKEIGVKKSIGANRASLISQYVVESALSIFISFGIALVLVLSFLPQLKNMIGQEVSITFNLWMIGGICGLMILTILLAASYPALYLSGIRPVLALKGKIAKRLSSELTRKALVVFQFTMAAILISSVIIVYKQLELIQQKPLGYHKDQLIWFKMGLKGSKSGAPTPITDQEIEDFLQRLKNMPGVVEAANFGQHIMGEFGTTTGIEWPGKNPDHRLLFANLAVGYDFVETMGIEMKEGRNYARSFQTDTSAKIIFNEIAIKAMGIDHPIGKHITLWGEKTEIIGVTQNFHYDKLYNKIGPLFLKLTTDEFADNIMVNIAGNDGKATIKRIEQLYKEYFLTGLSFEYQYLDENYQKLYEEELRIGTFAKYATAIAILIACLGLYGFASFTIQRRLKEIAIRKVLGSGKWQIVQLLSGAFLILISISLLIGLPISYLITQEWLNTFSFKIDQSIWYFGWTIFFILLLTFMTIAIQTISATGVRMVQYIGGDS